MFYLWFLHLYSKVLWSWVLSFWHLVCLYEDHGSLMEQVEKFFSVCRSSLNFLSCEGCDRTYHKTLGHDLCLQGGRTSVDLLLVYFRFSSWITLSFTYWFLCRKLNTLFRWRILSACLQTGEALGVVEWTSSGVLQFLCPPRVLTPVQAQGENTSLRIGRALPSAVGRLWGTVSCKKSTCGN